MEQFQTENQYFLEGFEQFISNIPKEQETTVEQAVNLFCDNYKKKIEENYLQEKSQLLERKMRIENMENETDKSEEK